MKLTAPGAAGAESAERHEVKQRIERPEVTMSKAGSKVVQTALMVLGMHRSGTSAFAGVLAKLGAQPPKTLMPSTQDNPRGYWESSAVMQFNNAILASAGTRWDDWEAFNRGWCSTPTGKAVMSELPVLLKQEFGNAPLFLVKDPRICRLLPVWLQSLSALKIATKIVVPFRHPVEVAQSLETRNRITRLQALLIWLRHVLDAESDSRGHERVFVPYASLLTDWRRETTHIAQTLGIEWPRRSGATEAEIDAYLTTELRRQIAEPRLAKSTPIMEWVGEAYAALGELAEGCDENAAQVRLDVVRQEFDASADAFAPLFHEVRADLEKRLGERSTQVSRVGGEIKELRAENTSLKQELSANHELAMKYKAELNDVREQFHNCEATLTVMKAKHQSGQDELGHIRHASEAASSAVEMAKAELASATASFQEKIAVLQHESVESRQRIEDLLGRLAVAESSTEERLAEIVLLTRRIMELEDTVSARDVAMTSLKADMDRCNAQQEAQFARLETQKRSLEEQARRVQALLSELHTQAMVISRYHRELEVIQLSNRWILPRTLRMMAGKAIHVSASERSAGADEDLLRKSKLFDGDWYLRRYPDVREGNLDPVKHYLQYGAREGRDPGPVFSTSGYRTSYPDVAAGAINPLVHYLVYGRNEGRNISASDSKMRKED